MTGGFSHAAEPYGFTTTLFCEIDPACQQVIKYHFNGMPIASDVCDVRGDQIEPVDVVTFGSPCFPAGTLVLTEYGYKPIEEIKVGTKVFTHMGNWQRVSNVGNKYSKTIMLKGSHYGLEITPNHPIWSAEAKKHYPTYSNGKRGNMRELTNVGEWTRADRMQGKRWAIPRVIKGIDTPVITSWSNKANNTPLINENSMYFIGRWLGDGWLRDGQRPKRPVGQTWGQIFLCCSHDEADEVQRIIYSVFPATTRFEERTVTKFRISNMSFAKWLKTNFGEHAEGKTIPAWVFCMEDSLKQALLRGYMDADGWMVRDGFNRITTVSIKLAHGIRLLAETLGYSTAIYKSKMPESTMIEDRIVAQRTMYQVDINSNKRTNALISKTHSWYPVKTIMPYAENKKVFNIAVENDNSYVVEGFVVHNCQDLSVAGNRAGLIDGKRSGLFFEAIRVIREMRDATNGDYPRYAVWENVPGAFTSNRGQDFRAVLEAFSESEIPMPGTRRWAPAGVVRGAGRSIAWRVLDAQFWGVPQRRDRIYLVTDFRGQSAPQILFERQGDDWHSEKSGKKRQETSTAFTDGFRTRCKGDEISGEKEIAHTGTLLRELRKSVGTTSFEEWIRGAIVLVQQKKILLSEMYGRSKLKETKKPQVCEIGETSSEIDCSTRAVCRLWQAGGQRCPPRQWQPTEQLAIELGQIMQEMSHKAAPSETILRCLWQASEGEEALRQSLSDLFESREAGEEVAGVVGNGAAPVFSVQHSIIGRKESAGAQGKGWRDDGKAFTIDSRADADYVAYPVVGFNGWRSITGTLEYAEEQAPNVVGTILASGSGTARTGSRSEAELYVTEAYGCDLSQKADGIGFHKDQSACIAPGTHAGHGNHVLAAYGRVGHGEYAPGVVPLQAKGGDCGGGSPEVSHAIRAGASRADLPDSTTYIAQEVTDNADADESNAREILSNLWQKIGENAFKEWGIRVCRHVQQEEILQQNLHGRSVPSQTQEAECELVEGASSSAAVNESRTLREVRQGECQGCPPQGSGLAEQRAIQFNESLPKLSQLYSQAETCLRYLWKAGKGTWLLREALPEIQEIWQSAHVQSEPIYSRYRVRRLAPLEALRCFGYPDDWLDIAETFSTIISQTNLRSLLAWVNNAALKDAIEKALRLGSASCTIKGLKTMEIQINILDQTKKLKNVSTVTSLLDLVPAECVAPTIYPGKSTAILFKRRKTEKNAIEVDKVIRSDKEHQLRETMGTEGASTGYWLRLRSEDHFCPENESTILTWTKNMMNQAICGFTNPTQTICGVIVLWEHSLKNSCEETSFILRMVDTTSQLSDTSKYRMCGNSIAIPCARFVMSRIARRLRQ